MNTPQRYPNLFIVGAPKSGTTAMARHLQIHPDIYTPLQKEFTFFGKDLIRYAELISEQRYLDWFKDWEEEKYALDASPTYLYSQTAPYEFKDKSPGCKAIIMLRNPLEVAYSMYFEALQGGREDRDSFETAWNMEEKRLNGVGIPKNARLEYTTRYKSLGLYSQHVQHYWNVLGKENVHIIIFDDFKIDNKLSYIKLLNFLEIPLVLPNEFRIHNPSTKSKFKFITHFATTPPTWMGQVGGLFLSKSTRWKIRNFIRQKNMTEIKKAKISQKMQLVLTEHYSAEIDSLSALLNRDLSNWKSSIPLDTVEAGK